MGLFVMSMLIVGLESIPTHLFAFADVTGTKAKARVAKSLQDLTVLVVQIEARSSHKVSIPRRLG